MGSSHDAADTAALLDLLTTSCVVVTTHRAGALVASIMPIGFDTPYLVLGLTSGTRTERGVRASRVLVVNLLAETDIGVARVFAAPGEKLGKVAWAPGTLGAPVLSAGLGALECRVVRTWRADGSRLVLARVVTARRAGVIACAGLTARSMQILDARRLGLEEPRTAGLGGERSDR